MRSCVTASGRSTLSIVTDDGRAQWLPISRGYGQGIQYSTALADSVMAQTVAGALEILDSLDLPDRERIIITSVADNISTVCPIRHVAAVNDALVRSAEKQCVHLDDQRIDLQGSTVELDAAQAVITATDPRFGDWISRPDLTLDLNDVYVLFGVPIYGEKVRKNASHTKLESSSWSTSKLHMLRPHWSSVTPPCCPPFSRAMLHLAIVGIGLSPGRHSNSHPTTPAALITSSNAPA